MRNYRCGNMSKQKYSAKLSGKGVKIQDILYRGRKNV